MTDNDIVKALECCTTNVASCKDCPAFVKVDRSNCKKYFRGALDLINRLQAENEELQQNLKEAYIDIKEHLTDIERLKYCNGVNIASVGTLHERLKTAKAEAYKECLDKIEQRDVSESDFYIMVKKTEFDNLLKEMEGGASEVED